MKYLSLDRVDGLMKKYSKADEYIVHGLEKYSNNIRFHCNTINRELICKKEVELKITSYFGKKSATVIVNSINEEEIAKGVALCEDLAKNSPDDLEYISQLEQADYSFLKPNVQTYSIKQGLEVLKPQFDRMKREGITSYGSLEATQTSSFILNNLNLSGSFDSSHFKYNVTAKVEDTTGWAHSSTNQFDELNFEETNNIAIKKAFASKDPIELDPGKYNVILEASALGELLMFIMSFLLEKRIDEGISPFSGKSNTTVSNKELSLISSKEHGFNYLPWSKEGVPASNGEIIKSGVLKDFYRNRFYASKKNKEPKNFGNLILLGDRDKEKSLDNIIEETKNGILVTRFWYTRVVDPSKILLTGMTRDGLFEIKDGKINRAIKNFRFNESLLNVLKNIDLYSATQNAFMFGDFEIACPNVRVKDFNFSSKTMF